MMMTMMMMMTMKTVKERDLANNGESNWPDAISHPVTKLGNFHHTDLDDYQNDDDDLDGDVDSRMM